jgi:hypothetical protein
MPNPVEAWRRLPTLVRFVVRHAAIGFGIAAVFVGALLLADPGGAGSLLLTAADHWWPAVALWFFIGLTFGAVQIGAATMLLAEAGQRPSRGIRAPASLEPVPVRIRARPR